MRCSRNHLRGLWQDMDQLPPECLGPKMQALVNDMKRRFAFVMACGQLTQAEAARAAGYSDKGDACKVRASELMQDPNVLDAIEEAAKKVLRGLAPVAIAKARAVLDDPEHPSHARMIETILDRTGHFARTEHKVTVEHTVSTAELEALAMRLANEAGIDPAKLIGWNDMKVIDGTANESTESHGDLAALASAQ